MSAGFENFRGVRIMIHDGFQSEAAPDPEALGVDGVSEARRVRRKAPSTKVAALNITAMMDLVLNLLLFFVLSASFAMAEGGLPAKLPPVGEVNDKGPAVDGTPFTIAVHAYGDQAMVEMNGSVARLDPDALHRQLDSWRYDEKHPDGIFRATHQIVIKPDRGVPWSQVVEVFNAVVRAKYSDVSLAEIES